MVLFFFFFLIFYLFIYLWLYWVFVSVRGLSPVAASGGHSSSQGAGLSLSRPLSLRSTGSRRAGSVIVAHGPNRSAARGILPDQGSNPCPLHWQADPQPLRHQGSPLMVLLNQIFKFLCNISSELKLLFEEFLCCQGHLILHLKCRIGCRNTTTELLGFLLLVYEIKIPFHPWAIGCEANKLHTWSLQKQPC